jgi:multiple antibiotic resistance protein
MGLAGMTMSEILSFCLLAFTSTFFIINPLGAAPIFLALTDGWSHQDRVRAARRATLVAGAVLVVFSLTGNLIFRLFGVTLGAFRLAGGILLLLVAMDMLHGKPTATKSTAEDHQAAAEKEDIAVTPLAIPQLAGPGSIATVILLPGDPRVPWRVVPVVVAIALTLLIAYLLLRGAERVQRFIGQSGTRIMTKIMGLLIAAVAMEFVATGVRDLLPMILEKVR